MVEAFLLSATATFARNAISLPCACGTGKRHTASNQTKPNRTAPHRKPNNRGAHRGLRVRRAWHRILEGKKQMAPPDLAIQRGQKGGNWSSPHSHPEHWHLALTPLGRWLPAPRRYSPRQAEFYGLGSTADCGVSRRSVLSEASLPGSGGARRRRMPDRVGTRLRRLVFAFLPTATGSATADGGALALRYGSGLLPLTSHFFRSQAATVFSAAWVRRFCGVCQLRPLRVVH
jgi:hypothetical protein